MIHIKLIRPIAVALAIATLGLAGCSSLGNGSSPDNGETFEPIPLIGY